MTLTSARNPGADGPDVADAGAAGGRPGGGRAPRRRVASGDPAAAGAPRWLFLPAVIGLALLVLPLIALIVRTNWHVLPAAVTSPAAVDALWLSLRTGVAATVVCLIVGLPLAVVVARSGPRIGATLRVLVTLPLVLPPMVGGIALLFLLGRRGMLGASLSALGISIPFTTLAVVIAQSFVAMPFLVISVEGALRTAGTRYETVASTLGAGRWRVFLRVTLPLIWPSLTAGTVLCFARALGEFGATALFAGNQQGVTRTMPLAIYTAFNGAGVTQDSATALALLLMAAALVILVLMRGWRSGSAR